MYITPTSTYNKIGRQLFNVVDNNNVVFTSTNVDCIDYVNEMNDRVSKQRCNVINNVGAKSKFINMTLPTTKNPLIFGQSYWNGFSTLASEVPCPTCRAFATQFISFMHDVANLKTGKPLYDAQNFNYFMQSFARMNQGQSAKTAFKI